MCTRGRKEKGERGGGQVEHLGIRRVHMIRSGNACRVIRWGVAQIMRSIELKVLVQ